jgi:dihydroorotate dehydrogenase electron transfer subunit
MKNRSTTNRGIFSAIVCANKQIGQRFYRLGLEFSGAGAEAFAKSRPGQFAELDLAGTALPPAEAVPKDLVDVSQRKILLRRPFSFCKIAAKGEKTFADILYCVVGPASLRMTTLSAGDSVGVIGPLGNGFWVPKNKKTALLVAGGMGAPPLQHLAEVLTSDNPDVNVTAFAGANTKEELLFETQLEELTRQKIERSVATDDGSAGYHGFITDCFSKWLDQGSLAAEDTIIYSCGPEAMLGKVAKIAQEKEIDCQMSMERMMACGIGVCQSCAVGCKVNGSNERVYKLCCEDGPVFDSKEVVF